MMLSESAQYIDLALFAALGGLTAVGFYGALWLNARLYLTRPNPWWPFMLHIARFAGLALFFWWAAKQGAGPLLAALGGHRAPPRLGHYIRFAGVILRV